MTGFEPRTSGIGSDRTANWSPKSVMELIFRTTFSRAIVKRDLVTNEEYSGHDEGFAAIPSKRFSSTDEEPINTTTNRHANNFVRQKGCCSITQS